MNVQQSTLPTETHKHTSGDWHLQRDVNREKYSVVAPQTDPGAIGYREIASLSFGFDEPFESQQHANARLIAAAPDMSEALRRALSWLSSYPGNGAMGAYDQAVEALKKAGTYD